MLGATHDRGYSPIDAVISIRFTQAKRAEVHIGGSRNTERPIEQRTINARRIFLGPMLSQMEDAGESMDGHLVQRLLVQLQEAL
jgi:hypothetical protein